MELSEKIQKLRKEHNMTQEQFAEKLFHITLDDLLSTEEIVVIAESENKENIKRFASYMDGIINLAALLALIIPWSFSRFIVYLFSYKFPRV